MQLGIVPALHALRAGRLVTNWRQSRSDLQIPLALCGGLLGLALLSLCLVDDPRVPLAVVILTVITILAMLRELIFGDR